MRFFKKKKIIQPETVEEPEILSNIDHDVDKPEYQLWLSNGQIVESKNDLAQAISSMTAETYQQHVHGNYNEFAEWVRDVLGDAELGNRLTQAHTQHQAAKVLGVPVKEIEPPIKPVVHETTKPTHGALDELPALPALNQEPPAVIIKKPAKTVDKPAPHKKPEKPRDVQTELGMRDRLLTQEEHLMFERLKSITKSLPPKPKPVIKAKVNVKAVHEIDGAIGEAALEAVHIKTIPHPQEIRILLAKVQEYIESKELGEARSTILRIADLVEQAHLEQDPTVKYKLMHLETELRLAEL